MMESQPLQDPTAETHGAAADAAGAGAATGVVTTFALLLFLLSASSCSVLCMGVDELSLLANHVRILVVDVRWILPCYERSGGLLRHSRRSSRTGQFLANCEI
jgi:hypothetical protein